MSEPRPPEDSFSACVEVNVRVQPRAAPTSIHILRTEPSRAPPGGWNAQLGTLSTSSYGFSTVLRFGRLLYCSCSHSQKRSTSSIASNSFSRVTLRRHACECRLDVSLNCWRGLEPVVGHFCLLLRRSKISKAGRALDGSSRKRFSLASANSR